MNRHIWLLMIDDGKTNPHFYAAENTEDLEKILIDYVRSNYEENMEEPIPVDESDDYIRDRYFRHSDNETWQIEPAVRADHPSRKGG